MISLVSYEVKRCFFVLAGGLGDTSSFTNAGTSLEKVFKGLRVTAPEQGSSCGFGAKNWETLRTFSVFSKLSHLMGFLVSAYMLGSFQYSCKQLFYCRSIHGQITKIFGCQKRHHAWIDVHGEGQRSKECTDTQDNENDMRREKCRKRQFLR